MLLRIFRFVCSSLNPGLECQKFKPIEKPKHELRFSGLGFAGGHCSDPKIIRMNDDSDIDVLLSLLLPLCPRFDTAEQ